MACGPNCSWRRLACTEAQTLHPLVRYARRWPADQLAYAATATDKSALVLNTLVRRGRARFSPNQKGFVPFRLFSFFVAWVLRLVVSFVCQNNVGACSWKC